MQLYFLFIFLDSFNFYNKLLQYINLIFQSFYYKNLSNRKFKIYIIYNIIIIYSLFI